MARPVAVPDSPDGSGKENRGKPLKVKAEKGRRSHNTGLENGSQNTNTQTSARSMANGEESEDEDEEREGSPKGAKRVRLSEDAEEPAVADEEGPEQSQRAVRVVALPRDEDGYIPGSIIHIELHQFLTYDHVDFRPGAYLNMILGPNGTGKSSIACAICIGLCFPLSLLGRATEVKSFVKKGYTEGYTQITLKGKKGEKDIVIRRMLNDRSNATRFTINGEDATATEVKDKVKSLHIQVNNLCTFLPQDRVAEFARMNPQELLRQTQHAAGHPKLIEWHDRIINCGKEIKNLEQQLRIDEAECQDKQRRNERLQDEVKRYEQRKELEHKRDFLELCVPFKEYIDVQARYKDLKVERDELHAELQEHHAKNKPMHDFKTDLAKRATECMNKRNKSKDLVKNIAKELKRASAKNEELEEASEEVHNKLEKLKQEGVRRKERIQETRRELNKIENWLANPPEMEEQEAIDADQRAVAKELTDANNKLIDAKSKLRENATATGTEEGRIQHAQDSLKRLDDASHRQLESLASWDRNCADVVRWLRANQHRFQRQVIEPAYLSVTVPDTNYAMAIEGCFNAAQMKTFVCQTREDYTLLNRLVIDTPEALGRKQRIPTFFRPLEEHTLAAPPMSEEEMKALGFDKYALDCVQCPEPMKWYLKRETQLHRTAIALDGRRVDVGKAMEAASRIDETGKGGGANFIAGRTLNQVQRSRYGARLPQNMTRELLDPRTFRQHAADQEAKKRYETDIKDAEMNLQQLKEAAEPFKAEESAIQAELRALKEKDDDIRRRREVLRRAQLKVNQAKARHSSLSAKLQEDENAPSAEQKKADLSKELTKIEKKRGALAETYCDLAQKLIKENTRATKLALDYMQLNANKAKVEEMVQTADQRYGEVHTRYERVKKDFEAAKTESKEKLDASIDKLNQCSPKLKEEFKEKERAGVLAEKSMEEYLEELAQVNADLELNLATNAGVIEQFENRRVEIANLETKIESNKDKLSKVEARLKKDKDKWLPELQDLVRRISDTFSAAFDRVGCAGEIKLGMEPPDDYSKWTIDIMVKFRDNERLQQLTGQRQSGGERALSTIMYLMSLTELARTPFSLVDEINQGMDADYERAVHNSLVEVTCRPDSGQYFLITPKLLTDLHYHPLMKVLCVNNGEWLPEPDEKTGDVLSGNMMSWVDMFEANKYPNGPPNAAVL